MSRRQDNYKAKGVFKQDELRRRREEAQVEIRRQKREESMAKRRNLNIGDDTDGADSDDDDTQSAAIDAQLADELPKMIDDAMSDNLDRQLDATTKFRKLLSKEKNPPIERVIAAGVVGVAASSTTAFEVVELDTATGRSRVVGAGHTDAVDPAYLPAPREITVTGPGGREVHAQLYPPHNPGFAAPGGELPPYVVWVHGGPTSRAPLVLDLEIAYFTSRGIGVAEVNYGGSTGYGRAYRERLREQWGVVDVEDCVAVARALADEGTADPRRLAIRGGSAGGWTTGAALTSVDVFACGTISYPILDLRQWAENGTHDFESRYLESLVGPLAEVPERYRDRSPAAHADRIRAPFLLLQGLDDVICPPAQCERFLDSLAGHGVPHAYLTFQGEGHGFRRKETIVAALEAELSLYGQVFGFTPPGIPQLELVS